MKKKLLILSACSFIIAIVIFIVSYLMYHHMGSNGHWLTQWQPSPGKPYITLLFSIWGVMFLFSSIMSALCAIIFFHGKK